LSKLAYSKRILLVDDNRWSHIAFTFAGHAGNITGYLNGVATTPVQYFVTGNYNLAQVGRYLSTSKFAGNLSETAFFSDVITSTEINDIFDNGLAGSGEPPITTLIKSKVIFF
jgi:hypothetical protein